MKTHFLLICLALSLLLSACSIDLPGARSSEGEVVTEQVGTSVEEQTVEDGEAVVENEAAAPENATDTDVAVTNDSQEDTTEVEVAEPVPAEEMDWLTVTGRTDNNLAYIGNPDAAVTMIEYSDFM